MSNLDALIFHPIAVTLVVVLVAIIAFCAVTEKRSSKPFDPWRK